MLLQEQAWQADTRTQEGKGGTVKEFSSMNQNHDRRKDMLLKTRIFELCSEEYKNLSELAQAMKISVSQIYGVRQGKCRINEKLIIGAIKAFPEYNIGDLFYLTS